MKLPLAITAAAFMAFAADESLADRIVPKYSPGWNYLHVTDSVDPGTIDSDFHTTWFDPAAGNYDGPDFVEEAKSPFHYGDVGDLTGGTILEIPAIPRKTSYFYKEFSVDCDYSSLAISLLADDGAFVYLDGTLIATQNVGTTDSYQEMALQNGNEMDYIDLTLTNLPPSLTAGSHVIAISLHNASSNSSDLGFDFELRGDPLTSPPGPLVPRTPTSNQITREPYLQSASGTSMTLRWRTSDPGTSIVLYGDAPDNLTSIVTVPGQRTDHEVLLPGLEASTTYYYEVISEDVEGTVESGATLKHYFRTYPEPGERKPARLWVVGDSGTTTEEKLQVYHSYRGKTGSAHTDGLLMLGDNAYENGTDAEFQAALFNGYPEMLRNTVLWSCLGNHEAYTANGAPYIDIHTFPTAGESGGIPSGSERYFSFDHGNIHFVSIDSQTEGNFNDEPGNGGMVDWLEQDLQSTDADWIVAFFHHGPFTKGSHDSDTETHHIEMRNYVVPLLEQYGVDLVLSGHSHSYERSMLIDGHYGDSSTFDSTTHVVDGGNGSEVSHVDASGNYTAGGGDGAYVKLLTQGNLGAIYSVAGASAKLSTWDNGSDSIVNPEPHPVHIVNLRVLGSIIITVDGDNLNAQYLDDQYAIRDDFTIHKDLPALPGSGEHPKTWSEWLAGGWGATPVSSVTEDADGDGNSALLEYAYCETDTDGFRSDRGLVLESNSSGGINAILTVPQGMTDLTYTLEISEDGYVWQDNVTPPTVTPQGDGTETRVWQDIESSTTVGISLGYGRIRVDLDDPLATVHSRMLAWYQIEFPEGSTTFGMEVLEPRLFGGQILGTTTDELTFSGANFDGRFVPTVEYYAEVLDGPHAGHRFEVDETSSSGANVRLDLNAEGGTLSSLPSDLPGARVDLRRHITLGKALPVANFHGGVNPVLSDQVHFYSGNYQGYFLLEAPFIPPLLQWTSMANSLLADAGGKPIFPGTGVFVKRAPNQGAVSLTITGEVRTTAFRQALPADASLVTGGFPGSASPTMRNLLLTNGFTGSTDPAHADQIQLWKGDTSTGASGYQSYFLLDSGAPEFQYWTEVSDSLLTPVDDVLLFAPGRALFLKLQNPVPTYSTPSPWP